ncbi:MAG: tRNA (adenosine(37)-N6)-threonylcarbamoyltransferase complex ATPase subunit type 1 TsaE, partial [Methylocystaceae bacterium]
MELIIPSAEDMIILGEQLGQSAEEGDVIYLAGELGMGKTTLVKGIGRGLGCKEMITSPTFTLVNMYTGRMTLYHCDFYRLSGDDAEQLGIKELIGQQGLFAVEWAETIHPEILPAGLNIRLEL